MNPIQRAWLKVLQPVAFVLNEKMAKRSGVLGRAGRFFAIGPREYGVHPSVKFFRAINNMFLNLAATTHTDGMFKALTQRGYSMYNAYMHLHWLPTFCLAYLLFVPLGTEWYGDSSLDNENLGEVILNSGGFALPTGALNFRKSAHFIEINSIYGAEMTRRFEHKYQQLKDQRSSASDKEKRTKFAVSGYTYTPIPTAEVINN